MSKKSKKGRSLRRRYGHFGMQDISNATAGVRKMAQDNPAVTAAAIGAATGAIAAGMTAASAAMVGAVAGIAVQQGTRK